jgi:adenosylmethionine-8-amino-7-oxononanoate aminotransferase
VFDLRPDMITVAKGITSGYAPLGGVLIAPRVWQPFFSGEDAPVFRHGVTYSGHATACAVAQANLDVIEEEDLVARVATLTPELAAAVAPLADHPLVTEVRAGVGLLAGVQLNPDVSGDAVTRHCLKDGILLRVITNNTLQISPPFVVDADDLRRIAAAIAAALDMLAG